MNRDYLPLALGLGLMLSLGGCDLFDFGEDERGDAQPGDPCEDTVDCTPGSICWNDICVQDGTLRFSLSWEEDVDLDLHVMTPEGNEIYFSNREADDGELDVDDCVGSCINPDGKHVENVFFGDDAPEGEYLYWVDNYGCGENVDFEIEVAYEGDVEDDHSGEVDGCEESEHYAYDYD